LQPRRQLPWRTRHRDSPRSSPTSQCLRQLKFLFSGDSSATQNSDPSVERRATRLYAVLVDDKVCCRSRLILRRDALLSPVPTQGVGVWANYALRGNWADSGVTPAKSPWRKFAPPADRARTTGCSEVINIFLTLPPTAPARIQAA
jgi:hypothetical protein